MLFVNYCSRLTWDPVDDAVSGERVVSGCCVLCNYFSIPPGSKGVGPAGGAVVTGCRVVVDVLCNYIV